MRFLKLLQWSYIICFFTGGFIHCVDIYNGGFLPYRSLPFWLNVYLTSLSIIDITAALLVIIRPKIGIWMIIVIITSDIALDIYANQVFWRIPFLENYRLLLLCIVGLYILITAPLFLKKYKKL